jgi:hypothetical protein
MIELAANLQVLGQAIVFSFLLFLFGSILHSLQDMFGLANKTWQHAFTRFLASLLGAAGVAAAMIMWIGVSP